MARIVVTSDLHYDDEVDLTPPEAVHALVEEIRGMEPDAVVLAGDLGHPLRNFVACIECFAELPMPVGVVPGNHDIWKDPSGTPGSLELWEQALPQAVGRTGLAWLERDMIVIGRTAIVGTLGWYDYSAVDPALGLSPHQLADLKQHATNDSVWVDLPFADAVFARRLASTLVERLSALEWDPSIDRVVIATHVPLFEPQMARRTDEASWGLLRAYFGNFTTGQKILGFNKVHALVSGHVHRPVSGRAVDREGAPPLPLYVVGSDYGMPSTVTLDIPEEPYGAQSHVEKEAPPRTDP